MGQNLKLLGLGTVPVKSLNCEHGEVSENNIYLRVSNVYNKKYVPLKQNSIFLYILYETFFVLTHITHSLMQRIWQFVSPYSYILYETFFVLTQITIFVNMWNSWKFDIFQ